MLDPTAAGTWLGLFNGLCLFSVGSIRRKRFDAADVGPAAVVFLASYNLWPPVVLFRYAVDGSLKATLPPGLVGYEKYLAVAAFCSLLLTLIGIASAYVKAWKVPTSPEAGAGG